MLRTFTKEWTEAWTRYECYGSRELLEIAQKHGVKCSVAWGDSELIEAILLAQGIKTWED